MLVDTENFVYQLLLAFGCDLNAPLSDKFDVIRLAFVFIAAALCIYFVFKFLYICTKNMFGGRSWL